MQKVRGYPQPCIGVVYQNGKEQPCSNKTPHTSGLCYIHRKAKSRELSDNDNDK